MGMNYYVVKKKPSIDRAIHIGKASAGWKFLFHDIKGIPSDYELELHTFEQWRDWLKANVGPEENKEYVILNEDDDEKTVDEFLELVATKQKEDNPDNYSNARNINGYRFTDGDFS